VTHVMNPDAPELQKKSKSKTAVGAPKELRGFYRGYYTGRDSSTSNFCALSEQVRRIRVTYPFDTELLSIGHF
jgi:hypothetical protein